MAKIRVLVVDDSVIVRRVVMEELSAQSDIEVVGLASSGKAAIEKLGELEPDLVILDVEMPEMDGLTALRLMRQTHSRIPIIMFSSLTTEGAAATLEALARGATDFFPKPSGPGGLEASRRVIRDELAPAIRALCPLKGWASPSKPTGWKGNRVEGLGGGAESPSAIAKVEARSPSRIDVLAIGASTGGPNALADLFAELPREFPVPIVIVQHMPPMFTQMLAERLSRTSAISTFEAASGMTLEAGCAYVAPGDFHLTLVPERGKVLANVEQGPAENACRPAFDPLLRSVAALYGKNSLTVVLTGMGQDGLRGCEAIYAVQGQVLAQDEATSIVWGMPGHVVRAGLAEQVLPLPAIAGEIVRRVRIGRG